MSDAPLHGLRVLDFTTLLPGPLATLLLAEAGATVVKIEPPGGEDMRRLGERDAAGESIGFQMLNRGKHCRWLDLKSDAGRAAARALAASADVLVEQFRPGVMDRLGLGATALEAVNPRLIYCSLTGYGQAGPRAGRAGHDINYVAETGLLASVQTSAGEPLLSPPFLADIGGGSWPAVMNIVLALYRRARDGRGCRLDISITDNLWPYQLLALSHYWATGAAPAPGSGMIAGGQPRYQLYRTRDDRWLAIGALEDRFFQRFAQLAGLLAGDGAPAPGRPTESEVAARVRQETAAYWLARCGEEDTCVSLVRDVGEAIAASRLAAAQAFGDRPAVPGAPPPLPLPLAASLRAPAAPTAVLDATAADWPAT